MTWIYILLPVALLASAFFYLRHLAGRCAAIDECAGSITVESGDKVYYVDASDRRAAETLAVALTDFNYFTGDRETFVRVGSNDAGLAIAFVLNDIMLSADGLDNIYGELVAEKIKSTFPGKVIRIAVCDYGGDEKLGYDVPSG